MALVAAVVVEGAAPGGGPRPPPSPLARLRALAVASALAVVAIGACVLDCAARRARLSRALPVRAAAARVVGPELALHPASRWLRHPTRVEPWAASADGPALLDTDPAGALAPPPAPVLRAGLPVVRARVEHEAGSRRPNAAPRSAP